MHMFLYTDISFHPKLIDDMVWIAQFNREMKKLKKKKIDLRLFHNGHVDLQSCE